MSIFIICPRCDGEGMISSKFPGLRKKSCRVCHGKGKKEIIRSL